MKKICTIICLALLTGCYNDSEEELYPKPPASSCDTSVTTYQAIVKPILVQHCTDVSCHDAATKSAGYDLTTYEGTKLASPKIIGCITWTSGSQMPKGMPKLSDCDIAKVSRWVNLGSNNN